MNDLRFAVRQLLKNPGFTAVAVVSLGLGIAANTTIFSFVNALLIRLAPVEKPHELWQVWRLSPRGGPAWQRYQGLSYPGYAYFRDHNRSFASLAAFDPETPFVSWDRDGVGQSVQCQFVSGNFFDVCGIRMALGRGFGPEDDRRPGAAPVAVVSHAFWKDGLGGDPQVVGRSLGLNGVVLTVVGVAPPKFTGLIAGVSPDVWAPFMMAPPVLHDREWHTRTGAFSHFGVGRLNAGVTPAQAEAELTTLTRQLEQEDPGRGKGFSAAVFPSTMVPAPFRGFVGGFTAVLMGAVAMVLLIACANAASLTLARAVNRRGEMAVRAALGASRRRLVRQVLTESVVLAVLAGAAALLMTRWFVPLLLGLTPPTLPVRPEVGVYYRVVLFTALVALLTGVVFGLPPAVQGSRTNPGAAIKAGARGAGVRRSRVVGALVVGQVAVSLVLLIAAALCLRSLFNARNVPLGFAVDGRVTAEVKLKDYEYTDEQVQRFNDAFIARVSAAAGVASVALADFLPLDTRSLGITYDVEGRQPPPGEGGFTLETFNVGPGFFATMGTTLLRGREFAASDRQGAPAVAVVNKAMADSFWPGQDPVGRRISDGKGDGARHFEVVGVVETGKYRTLGEAARPVVFRCRLQERGARSTFVARVQGDPAVAMAAMRAAARELDPRLSLSRLGTLEQHLALALFPARATGLLFAVFGGVALLLAVSGLFGVVAYSVSQRTREIGLRMAPGAGRRDVLRMILRQGLALTGAGIVIGLVAAVALTRLMAGLLYGISATDPATFVLIPLSLAAVALLASWAPARRAARVDPMEALRHE